MAASAAPDSTTLATLASLQYRLHRLVFYLTGETESLEQPKSGSANGPHATPHARLVAAEEKLAELARRKPGIRGLLELGTLSEALYSYTGEVSPLTQRSLSTGEAEANYPDLFHPSTSSPALPTTLSPTELLAIVTASAPEYHQTASRLTALKDLPLPPTDSSSALISLLPRMAKVELEQEGQEREIADLRERSAKVVQTWYEAGVRGEGECWGEWEGRVTEVEKGIRRKELMRRREEEEEQVYEH